MDYSLFPGDRLELRNNTVQVHANGIPVKTNLSFADITGQLPTRHNLTYHFRLTLLLNIFSALDRMPQITGWGCNVGGMKKVMPSHGMCLNTLRIKIC